MAWGMAVRSPNQPCENASSAVALSTATVVGVFGVVSTVVSPVLFPVSGALSPGMSVPSLACVIGPGRITGSLSPGTSAAWMMRRCLAV
ncbi:unannotated protein [freshwater metagenome]|uniref:Unannotated protein n=1 Tax=freshwater metagenome TaxID=449393 RepID=A0A6J6ZMY6_9ZZZZ